MISVIVPTYNEANFISKCLESLENQTLNRKEYEIIVSDGNSQDKTRKIAKEYADKVIVGKKLGAGWGRNYGVKHAKGELLAFIDADTIASPTWLEGVKESLSNAIASTGPIRALERDPLPISLFYRWLSFQFLLTSRVYPIFLGFNIGVRAKFFKRVGGFCTGNICEDMDLSLRLKRLGKITYNRKMLVHTSTRRTRKIGMTKYVLTGLKFLLFKRSMEWKKYRNFG